MSSPLPDVDMSGEYILRFITILPGIAFLFSGLLLKKFPAKKPNALYGYRTSTSMKSQETWDAAQQIGAQESIRLGLIQIVIGLAVGWTVATEVFPVAYLLVSALACAIALLMRTESKLRSLFPNINSLKS